MNKKGSKVSIRKGAPSLVNIFDEESFNANNKVDKTTLNALKELSERVLDSGSKYRLKHLKTMLPYGKGEYLPRFWDDMNISEEEHKEIEWMAGVEVHLHKIIFALYGRNVKDHRKKYLGPILIMKNNPQGFKQFKNQISEYGMNVSRFLMETTGVYHFPIAWFLQQSFPKSDVIAMNAWLIKSYMPKVSKNDKADAIRIAQVAQLDDFISASNIPTQDEMALRELARQRTKIMQESVSLQNRIKKVLSSGGFNCTFSFKNKWEIDLIGEFLKSPEVFGVALKRFKSNPFVRKHLSKYEVWKDFNLPKMFKGNVLLLFGLLNQTEVNLEMVETALYNGLESLPQWKKKYELLEDCTGLGVLNAICIVLETGDISRFSSAGHYLSYCGISPSSASSGYETEDSTEEKTVKRDTPNKHSNRNLKKIYVQAAGAIMRASRAAGSNSEIKDDMVRYGLRFVKDKRKRLKIKFKVAAKLARRIYYCQKMNIKYDPEYEFKELESSAKDDVKKLSKTPCKRKRQAWAGKIVNLMKEDIGSILKRIDVPQLSSGDLDGIKRDLFGFMAKYGIPDGEELSATGVNV